MNFMTASRSNKSSGTSGAGVSSAFDVSATVGFGFVSSCAASSWVMGSTFSCPPIVGIGVIVLTGLFSGVPEISAGLSSTCGTCVVKSGDNSPWFPSNTSNVICPGTGISSFFFLGFTVNVSNFLPVKDSP